MVLTAEEKVMLEGEFGFAAKKGMELLVGIGGVFNAQRLIPVNSVQVAGVSYQNIGDAGIEFLTDLAVDGKVRVFTTLNPCGIDVDCPDLITSDKHFIKKQKEILQLYGKLGIFLTCTCTPYLAGNLPLFGEHLAWSESSAVCFSNSMLGARSNREGGPSALASALTGKTPEYGMHLVENRKPQIRVEVKTKTFDAAFASVLGFVAAKKIGNSIPVFTGLPGLDLIQAKSLSASLATYSGVSIFHAPPFTPEEITIPDKKLVINEEELREAFRQLNDEGEPDLLAFGCPHLSIPELQTLFKEIVITGRQNSRLKVWFFMARNLLHFLDGDLLNSMKLLNIEIICDTCPAIAPIGNKFNHIATNSAKLVFYARGHNKLKTTFDTTENLLKLI